MNTPAYFRVVRFSSVPEYREPINVAILLVDNRARLVFDRQFPKFAGMSPDFSAYMLAGYLDKANQELQKIDPVDSHVYLSSLTSQFQIGQMQRIFSPITNRIERMLVELYLRNPIRKSYANDPRDGSDDCLVDEVLEDIALDQAFLRKRVKFSEIISLKTPHYLDIGSVEISRVINAANRIILIEGLNFGVSDFNSVIVRWASIGSTYYSLRNLQFEIKKEESMQLITVLILFNYNKQCSAKTEFLIRQINENVDLICIPETKEGMDQIKKLIDGPTLNK